MISTPFGNFSPSTWSKKIIGLVTFVKTWDAQMTAKTAISLRENAQIPGDWNTKKHPRKKKKSKGDARMLCYVCVVV